MIGIPEYILGMLLIAILAGLIGALVGIGGGILVVPILTLVFGIPVEYAIAASLVSVIATSTGSASAYVRDKITNMRVGMFLEVGTTVGAVIGAVTVISLVASGLSWSLFLVFGFVLIFSAYQLANRARRERAGLETTNPTHNRIADTLRLSGEYYDGALKAKVGYIAENVPAGFFVAFCAGLLSGLLGIGGGAVKVLAMDSLMKLPFKVSTTTSNFMIGVTAAASTGIFYIGGYLNPILAAPVAIGVTLGSYAGTKVLIRSRPSSLRIVFVAVLLVLGVEMIRQGVFP